MVSQRAVIGIGIFIFLITFMSVLSYFVLVEADRLQIRFDEALRILFLGQFYQFDCKNNNCYPVDTDIQNTCFEFDSTRSCTIQLNRVNFLREIQEKEGVIIIRGMDTKCFYPRDRSTGDEIPDEVLLCREDGRFDKKWWVLGEESQVGLDQFVTINVIGDQSYGDRTGQLQGMGLIGIP